MGQDMRRSSEWDGWAYSVGASASNWKGGIARCFYMFERDRFHWIRAHVSVLIASPLGRQTYRTLRPQRNL